MNNKGGKKAIICKVCGKTFYVFPYRVKTAQYCSFECHGKFSSSILDRSKINYLSGSNHPNYKGGWIHNGYRCIKSGGKYVKEHRLIMEKFLDRKLNENETIHHINHDRTDNRLENLEVLSRSDHSHLHPPTKRGERVTQNCFNCGCDFTSLKSLGRTYCSKECWYTRNK